MQISQILDAVTVQPDSLSPYLWDNYGSNHYYFDFTSPFDKTVGLSCIADFQGKEIKELTFSFNDKNYLWVNPNYIENRNNAHFERNLDPRVMGDNIKYIELEIVTDVFDKLNSIFTKNTCDTKVTISLDLGEDIKILDILKAADPNFDQDIFIENILKQHLDIFNKKNETFWDDIKTDLKAKNIKITFVNNPCMLNPHNENKQLITFWLAGLGLSDIFIIFKDKLTKTGLMTTISVNETFEFEFAHIL